MCFFTGAWLLKVGIHKAHGWIDLEICIKVKGFTVGIVGFFKKWARGFSVLASEIIV